ncbi:MAG: hypothetical protein U0223_11680 [Nitrospira sp.]|nr:hypothetical protein [Nitrospira sp.]
MSNPVFYEPKDDESNRMPTEQELRDVPRMSKAECRDIMRSPDYKRSKLAQALIKAAIAKGYTDEDEAGDADELGQRLTGDEIEAKQSAFRKMFKDPRYKLDGEFRREVHEKMKALTVNDQPLDDGALMTPNTTTRVSLSPFAHEAARVESLGVFRAESRTTDHIGPEKKAPAKPVREYFE